jgi:hypothetical protein
MNRLDWMLPRASTLFYVWKAKRGALGILDAGAALMHNA